MCSEPLPSAWVDWRSVAMVYRVGVLKSEGWMNIIAIPAFLAVVIIAPVIIIFWGIVNLYYCVAKNKKELL